MGSVVLFLSLLMLHAVAGQDDSLCPPGCDPSCQCSYENVEEEDYLIKVNCEDFSGENIAQCLNENVTSLSIIGSQITTIKAEDLQEGDNLKDLVVIQSPLNSIAFPNLTKLETLILTDNDLKDFDDNVFENLISVTTLDLSHNEIEILKKSTLNGMVSLNKLMLVNNSIDDIEAFAFQTNTELLHINLSCNQIDKLDKDSMVGPLEPDTLDISYNRLYEASPPSFGEHYRNLRILNANHNRIHILVLIVDMNKLEELYVAYNDLPEIQTRALKWAPALEIVDFSNNPIERIEKDSFPPLSKLTELYLDNLEELTEVEPESFTGLEDLVEFHLTGARKLKEFPASALPGNTSTRLEVINLQKNSLLVLEEDLFINKVSLQWANVEGNPLNCTCEASWIRQTMDTITTYPWVAPWVDYLKCYTPNNLKNRTVSSIDSYDLTCEPPINDWEKTVQNNEQIVFEVPFYT